MKLVGLIGCGAIGRPVARALLAGTAGAHALATVLARAPRDLDGFPVIDTADRFLAGGHDLIIEAGGPAAVGRSVSAICQEGHYAYQLADADGFLDMALEPGSQHARAVLGAGEGGERGGRCAAAPLGW